MSTISDLFRKEVQDNEHTFYGEIFVAQPLALKLVFLFALSVVITGITYLWLGEYTQKARVTGFLAPTTGFVRVSSPQTGIIVERHIEEGKTVQKGDTLFTITTERTSLSRGEAQASISRQLEVRKHSLSDDLLKQQQLYAEQRRALEQRIRGLQDETHQLTREIETQQRRTDLAAQTLAKFRELMTSNFVSDLQLQEKSAEWLDQQQRLQALERNQLSLKRDLETTQAELTQLPLREKTQIATIEREIAALDQELTESESRRQLTITAPQDGVVSGLTVDNGQTVNSGQVLLTLLPANMQLQAELFATSKAIGFIQPGQTVALRYQAYPYQKFGHQRGHVERVSQVSIQASELPLPLPVTDEALYKIVVNLDSQTIQANSKHLALQPGMVIEADVLLDTRRLFEWIFAPLYGWAKQA